MSSGGEIRVPTKSDDLNHPLVGVVHPGQWGVAGRISAASARVRWRRALQRPKP
jgi:hypothetical protein